MLICSPTMYQSVLCLHMSGSFCRFSVGLHYSKYPLKDLGGWRTPAFAQGLSCHLHFSFPWVSFCEALNFHRYTLNVVSWLALWLSYQVDMNQIQFAGTFPRGYPEKVFYTQMNLGLWKQVHQPHAQAVGGSLVQLHIPRVPRVPGGDHQWASMSIDLPSRWLCLYYFRLLTIYLLLSWPI